MIVKTRRLWIMWGRDPYKLRWAWRFSMVINPRPELTGEGNLIAGTHFTFWMDLLDFDVKFDRVPPTVGEAA